MNSTLARSDFSSQIVFIDANVSNADVLAAGIDPAFQVVRLNADSSALGQIATALQGLSGVEAIHLISHGSAGALNFAGGMLTAATLADIGNAGALDAIRASLSDSADVLIYGCDVAAGASGQAFIAALAAATGAVVAASTNATGAATLGGDWVLESATGAIDTASVSIAAYDALLLPSSGNLSINNLDASFVASEGGPAVHVDNNITIAGGTSYAEGYLRFAVDSANAGDQFALAGSATPLAAGAISLVGNDVYLGDGTTSNRIGSIDAIENGRNGQALKILFSSPLPNAGFEEDAANWTISTEQYGDSAGELNLDGLSIALANNSDSDSMYTGGTGTVNSQAATGTMVFNGAVEAGAGVAGSKALHLSSSGNIARSDQLPQSGFKADGYGSIHGPYATSAVIAVNHNDALSLQFKAISSNDDYEVFGLLRRVDGDGNFVSSSTPTTDSGSDNILLFAERGAMTDGYVTVTHAGLVEGNYRFVFVGGTYDATGGLLVGSNLYVDNIRLISGTTVNDAAVSAIAQQVTYQNTSTDTPETRVVTITAVDAAAASSSASTTLHVSLVNNAPSFIGDAALAGVNEDTSNPAGASVAALLATHFVDPDAVYAPADMFAGIAITANAGSSGQGAWQYSTDGSTWEVVGEVSGSSALLLSGSTLLRFLPAANYNGSPDALSLHAVDSSFAGSFSGATREFFDTTTDGATSPVSENPVTLSTSIAPVNDAPTAAEALMYQTREGDAAATLNLLAGASDVDTGDTATLSISNMVYSVDGGAASDVPPAGVSLAGHTLTVDPTDAVFDSMAAGEQRIITVSYNVTDVHGASVAQTDTITIAGSNDAPVAHDDAVIDVVSHTDTTLTFEQLSEGQYPNASNIVTTGGYSFTLVSGNNVYIQPGWGDGQSNALGLYSYGNQTSVVAMTHADGAAFSLASANITTLYYYENAAQSETVTGYLNGKEVVKQTFDVPNANSGGNFTNVVTLSGFDNVDRVLFSSVNPNSNYFYQWLDNIVASATEVVATHTEDQAIDIAVLANDADVDHGAALTMDHFSATSAQGASITQNADGTLHYDPTQAAKLQALVAGETVTDTFTYAAKDEHGAVSNEATVSVLLHGVNDAPVAAEALTHATSEGDAAHTLNLLAGAIDADLGETATLSISNILYSVDGGAASDVPPAGVSLSGHTLTLDPTDAVFDSLAAGAQKTVTVSYNVIDVHGASVAQTETITIAGSNDAPVAHDDAVLGEVTNGDAPLTFEYGTYGYVNNAIVCGGYSFVATNDNLGIYRGWGADQSLTLGVENYNGNVSDMTMTQVDGAAFSLASANITGYFYGTGGHVETVTGYLQGAVVATQTFDIPDTSNGGSFNNVVALTGFDNVDKVVFSLNRGVTSSYLYQWIDNIVASATVLVPHTEDQAIDIAVLANDTDVDDGAVLTVDHFSATSAQGASITQNADGTLNYDPTHAAKLQALVAGETLTDTFTYAAKDEHGAVSNEATVSVLLHGVNDAPVAVADTVDGTENQTLTIDVLANDTDADHGHSLTLQGVSVADGMGRAVIDGNQLVFNPGTDFDYLAAGETTTVEVAYAIADEHGAPSSSSVTITITGTNDAPVLDVGGAGTDGNDFSTTFRPRGAEVALVADGIKISDVDGDTILSATVSLATGAKDNLFGTIHETIHSTAGASFAIGGINTRVLNDSAIVFNGNGSGDHGLTGATVLTLSGAASHADYENALKTIVYNNSNPNAFSGDRTVTVTLVDDLGLGSNAATVTVHVPWTPVVDMNGGSLADGRNHVVSYVEGDGPVSIAMPDASITDQGGLINSITATLNNAPDGSHETLNVADSVVAWLAARGIAIDGNHGAVVTFTAAAYADASDFQIGLRGIQYANDSQHPDTSQRTVTVTTLDADGNTGVSADTLIDVSAVNDAPVGFDSAVATLEDQAYTFRADDFGFADPVDGGQNELLAIRISTLPSSGTLLLNGVALTEAQTVSLADIAHGLLTYEPGQDHYAPLPVALPTSFSYGGQQFVTVVNAEFSSADLNNTFRNGAKYDRYSLSGVANDTVIAIYQGNSSMDDYLQIERNGQILRSDDDSGDGENGQDSFLQWTYQAGDVIRSTTYGRGDTGSYSLYVSVNATVTDLHASMVVSASLTSNDASSFTFQVQDDGGTAHGGVDLSVPVTMTVHITPINDAPVLHGGAQAPAIDEDVANTGATVATMIADGSILDVDLNGAAPKAIAVTAVDNSHGAWEYHLAGGDWIAFDFGNQAPGTALLLGAGDSIRFVPDLNWNGPLPDGVIFHAWDQTIGLAGDYLDVASNAGGTGTLSIASASIAITVNPVNDAPTLAFDGHAVFNPRGAQVHLFDAATLALADVDAGAFMSSATLVMDGSATLDNAFGITYETLSSTLAVYAGSMGNITFSGNGTEGHPLTLSGPGTVADYKAALLTLVYNNANPNAYAGVRPVLVTVHDDAVGAGSNSAAATLNVAVNWSPVADLNGESVAGVDYTVSYVENNPGLAIAASDASLVDQQGNIHSVTVTLGNAPDGEQEQLFITQTQLDALRSIGIEVTGNNSHAITLTGNSDGTVFQLGLRSILYTNASNNPDLAMRAVTVSSIDMDGNAGVGATTFIHPVRVNDEVTGAVAISNDTDFERGVVAAQQNDVLHASNTLGDLDGMGAVTYQWLRDGQAVGGATGDTYALGQADVGKLITVVATYTDGGNTVEHVTSGASNAIINVNDAPVAEADVAAGTENAVLTIDVLVNDTDIDDGHAFTLNSASAPSGSGTASVVDGKVVFNPGADFDHLAKDAIVHVTLSYEMQDEFGAKSSSTVDVTITGTNDVPVVTNASAALAGTVSEAGNLDGGAFVAGTPTATGTLTATDVDAGATQTWSIQGTPSASYGAIAINAASGVWTYTLNNALAATQALKEGEVVTQTYTARVTDEFGAFVDQTVTLTINGTNDVPVVTNASAALAGTVSEAGNLDGGAFVAGTPTATGTLTATDVDAGATQTWSIQGTPSASYGAIAINAATGVWTYTLNNALAATQALKEGEVVTQTYTARVTDEFGAFVDQTVTLTINGTNDVPVVTNASAALAGTVSEAGNLDSGTVVAGTPTATGTLTATDVDAGATQTWSIQGTPSASYGAIAINAATGVWTYTLNNALAATQALKEGEVVTQTYTARVTDEFGAFVDQTVTVTINGTNDVPVVTNASAALAGTVSEAGNLDSGAFVAGTPTATGALTATDVDAGATQTWSIQGTPSASYGAIAIDAATGVWTYTLNNALAATQALKEGEVVTQTYTARVTDEFGAFVDQTVTVTINGTNDVPVVTNASAALAGTVSEAGNLDSGAVVAGTPTATGALTATDVDAGATQTWSIQGTPSASYGAIAIDAATGVWTYTLNNALAATQALKEGEVVTQTYTARVTDEFGAFVDQTVTLMINGTNDVPVVTNASAALAGTVSEAGNLDGGTVVAGTPTATGTLTATDVDAGASQTWSIQGTPSASYGAIAINAATGVWTYTLNNALAATQALKEGEVVTQTYTARVTDEFGAFVDQTVTLTINGTNDVPVVTNASAALAGTVSEAGNLDGGAFVAGTPTATGTLTATDVDAGASQTWSIQGTPSASYGAIAINAATGVWTYTLNNALAATQALKEGEVVTQTYTARVTDEFGAFVDQTVTLTINGTNDVPVVTNASAALAGTVIEAGNLDGGAFVAGTPTATGTLTATDVDAGATQTWSIQGTPSASYGAIAINAATGVWTYTLNNALAATQALKEGEVVTQTYTARVTDDFGAFVDQTVTLTINGTNDVPVVTNASAALAGTVIEAGNLDGGTFVAGTPTATGALTATDVDAGATQTWSIQGTPSASYGAIAINAATGVWTYTLNNALAATQALKEGEVVTQTYTARVTDEFGAFVDQTVTLTINGTNDSAVITGTSAVALVETDAILTTGGQLLVLTAVDVDSLNLFVAQTGVAGNRGHGTFSINAAGTWTYNANTAHNEFVAGLIYTDSLTVKTADGTAQVITVSITGTEDAPTISGDPTEGQLLTAANVLFDTNGMLVPVTYQWFADGVAITGATGDSFKVTGAELANAITVKTTYVYGTHDPVTTESAATMAYVLDASVPDAGKAVVQTIAVTATGATTTTPVALALNSGSDLITLGHQALDGETIVIPTGMVTPLGAFTIAGTGNTTGSEHFSLYVDSALAVNGYWVQNAAGTLVNLASAPYGGAMVTENGKTRLDFTIVDNSEFDTNPADHGIATTGLAAQMGLSIIGHVSDVPTAGVFF